MGKKIIAGLLLALFLFIQVVKVFHTHDKTDISHGHNRVAIQSNSNTCPICDFQLSKDSELPAVFLATVSFSFLQTDPVIFSSSCSYGVAASIPGRGPPAHWV